MSGQGDRWQVALFETLINDRVASTELRDASIRADLSEWTKVLTKLVVRSFQAMGFTAASKGFRGDTLPVGRNEYLSQDVMAFDSGPRGWKFPEAVCELENSADEKFVAYSLWKVLCVRCDLRVVVCYRPEPEHAQALITLLTESVVKALPIRERMKLEGDTLVVVGSRNEAETFPYGFFQTWKLNMNTGRFERFARQ